MAIGGVRNEVCRFNAISMAKKYGFTPNTSRSGRKIGTKMIRISDHSSGQPSRKMMIWARTRNCHGSRSIPPTQCAITSCPPRYENTDANVHEPTNSQQTIDVDLAVRNTLSLSFVHVMDR